MRIIFPYIVPNKRNTPAVYKMVIDTKWVYIGSASKIYNRFINWKNKLKAGTYKNRNIRAILNEESTVKFTILKKLPDGSDHKLHETAYIAKYFHKPFSLNMCPSGHDNKGMRMPHGFKYKVKIKKGEKVVAKPIARFDLNWNYIDQTRTITQMAEKLGCKYPSDNTSHISKVAKGKSEYYRGYKYAFINTDGSFEWPLLQTQSRQYKKVLQIDSSGKIVNRFNGISEAVKVTGAKRSSICKVIYGLDSRKTTGGYKYAYE